MDKLENWDPKKSLYSSKDEPEIDENLLAVREALLSLPKEECPAGFEYRLNRRLQGLEGRARIKTPAKSWVSGWMGVGLGFACAAVVALFTLDFNPQTPTTLPVTSTTEQAVPSAEPMAQQTPETTVGTPSTETQLDENLVSASDSATDKVDPTRLPSDRLRQVSGD